MHARNVLQSGRVAGFRRLVWRFALDEIVRTKTWKCGQNRVFVRANEAAELSFKKCTRVLAPEVASNSVLAGWDSWMCHAGWVNHCELFSGAVVGHFPISIQRNSS